MAALNLAGVVSSGFPLDDVTFTYFVSNTAQTDAAAQALDGKAVMLDTAAANTVKLTTDGAAIFGRVYKGEFRQLDGTVTASVQRHFKEKLPAATGHGILVGGHVVGAAGGLVRAVATGTPAEVTAGANNIVVETGTDFVVVEKLG